MAANLPPRRKTRRTSHNALSMSGTSIRANREIPASNESDGRSSACASITRVSKLESPSRRAASEAVSSMLAEMSVANTVPVGPTRRAAAIAWSPAPAPMSITLSPTRILAKSSIRSVTGAKSRTRSAITRCHSAAAVVEPHVPELAGWSGMFTIVVRPEDAAGSEDHTLPHVEPKHCCASQQNLTRDGRYGSFAHITAPQHCCPLHLNKQTPTGRVQCDALCHNLTHAPQQKASLFNNL